MPSIVERTFHFKKTRLFSSKSVWTNEMSVWTDEMSVWTDEMSVWTNEMSVWTDEMSVWTNEMSVWTNEMSVWTFEMSVWSCEMSVCICLEGVFPASGFCIPLGFICLEFIIIISTPQNYSINQCHRHIIYPNVSTQIRGISKIIGITLYYTHFYRHKKSIQTCCECLKWHKLFSDDHKKYCSSSADVQPSSCCSYPRYRRRLHVLGFLKKKVL
jgi:hypothetical protein